MLGIGSSVRPHFGRGVEIVEREGGMSGHTPGPWQVMGCRYKWRETHRDRQLDSHAVGPDSDPICLVFYGSPKQHNEQLANARLIAAAPDLLAAALQTEWFIENGRELGFIPVAPSEPALKAVKAAIAKVTGGECIGPLHRDCDSICRVNAKATGAP